MKRLILSTILLLLFTAPVFAQESITSFESNIVVQQDAAANITETITYNFGTNQKHGIFRNIPIIVKNQDGKRYKLDLKIVSVSDNYQTSTLGDNLQIKIGDSDKLITGEKIYKITYTVKGNVRYFSEHDEFYWNVNGTDWEVPIENISAQITIPNATINDAVCYSGIYGSTTQNCKKRIENDIAYFSANSLSTEENLSVDISFPKGIVAVVEPKEDTPGLIASLIWILFTLGVFVWYTILPFYIIYRWFRYGRDPKTNPNIPALYDPPKNKQGQKLLPGEVGTLVDESADNRDISATILDLAIKGYLKIKEEEKEKYSIIKQKEFEIDPSLKDYEKDVLTGIFKLGDKTTTKALENTFYQTSLKAKNKLYESSVFYGFFEKNPEDTRAKYYVLAGIAIFTGNVFLSLVSFVFGKFMPRKTQLGAEANMVALGLKKFLSSQERQLEFQSKNWFFFEKLLPYAAVFGVEKIWADRFKDLHVSPPDWYEGSNLSTFNTLVFINSLDNSLHSFEKVSAPMTESRSSSGFSSGFSGGGFSGGGGGGGGGGSW